MIQTILFDFDGVILDSMKIKGDGFKELFSSYDISYVTQLEQYHYANGGISRFEKIRYFFNTIMSQSITEKDINLLAEQFASIIAKKLFDKNNLISDTLTFLETHHDHYYFHVVSGAEHHELNALCISFGIAHYFKSIEGSPTIKSHLIRNLLKKNMYLPHETILIGDSINDYEAATANGILFYGYNNTKLKALEKYIETFFGFHP